MSFPLYLDCLGYPLSGRGDVIGDGLGLSGLLWNDGANGWQ